MMETTPQTWLVKTKEVLSIVVLIVLAVFLTYGIISMRKADIVLDEVNHTVIQSNALIVDTQKNLKGTFQNVNAILIQTGLASDEVRRAAETESVALAGYSTQITNVLNGLQETTVSVNQAVGTVQINVAKIGESTNQAIQAVPAVLEQSKVTLQTTDTTLQSLNKVLSDPNIQQTMVNVNQATENVNKSTQRLDNELADFTKPRTGIVKVMHSFFLSVARVF